MFGYSMVQMVRAHAAKLEISLREDLLNLYKPFKWIPCFLHNLLEDFVKKRKKFSVIIEFEEGCHKAGSKQVNEVMEKHRKNKVKRDFSRISCCSAEVTPKGLEEILSSCHHIRKIYLNRKVRALLDVAVPSANAKKIVRNNKVLTGKGVTIAIVDTGIYPHPDLAGRIIAFKDFIKKH